MVKMGSDPNIRNHIIETMVMRLDNKEAILYLKKNHIQMHERTYYKLKKKILDNRFKRLKEIFDYEFIDEYLQAINTIRDCQKKMYECYDKIKDKDPAKASDILTQIISSQPILVEFYHNTRKVIQRHKADQMLKESFI